jgi:hypothetical protein
VTAVYLPGRLDKTLRIYGFLDLSPDVNMRARAKAPSSLWRIALLLVADGRAALALTGFRPSPRVHDAGRAPRPPGTR